MSTTPTHTHSYPRRLKDFEKNAKTLMAAQPEVMEAFWGLHEAATADGALGRKTKELIALAISVVAQCDDCISHHTYDALEAGATREEIGDALAIAILMGGGTGVVYATHAIESVDQFLAQAG